MLSVALISLLVPAAGVTAAAPTPVLTQQQTLPVRVWLNKRDAQLGDRVRAYAETQADGYLLVLHAEPDGRVRVLFPVDPVEDNFVRGGDGIEIRGRGDRDAFRVYASDGVGTVLAAFSRDPFVFDQFVRADHWDYSLPDIWYVQDDAEAELTDIAVAMASGAYFDYDIAQYGVGDAVARAQRNIYLSYYGDYFGWSYSSPYYYRWAWDRWAWDPYYWGYDRYWGFNLGFSWGWAPYYWGWRPYYSSWRPYYWYPYSYAYYYWPSYYYGGYSGITYYGSAYGGGYVAGRPRLRYTRRLTPSNAQGRSRRVYAASHTSARQPLATAGGLTPATRSTGSSARRLTPTVASPESRTSPARRSTATTSRRNFPQQPARTTPARRVTTSDAVDRAATSAGQSGALDRVTTRRTATPTRTPTTATTQRVTPTRRTVTGGAEARPVRPTTSRSSATSSRTRPTAQPRSVTPRTPATARPSTPSRVRPSTPSRVTPSTPSRVRPSTPSRVTPSTPSRVRPSTPSRVRPSTPSRVRPSTPSQARPSTPTVRRPIRPSSSASSIRPSRPTTTSSPSRSLTRTRVTAPRVVRTSPSSGSRTAVRTSTSTVTRTTTTRRRRP
jgi:hypothetical protein